ncbi:MAG: hypothetical protein ACRDCW_09015 [Sarcina sp.]
MIKVAIFTPKYSYNYVKTALDNKDDICEKSYYIYKDLNELSVLYELVKNDVHAIITSGFVGYEVLKNHVDTIIPIYYFEIQKYELYQNILEVFCKNKDIDFTRVYIDFIGLEEAEELAQTTKIFPIVKEVDYSNLNLYENYREIYKELKENNKIDFIITRMSNMTEFLDELQIPYKFIFPSAKSLNESLINIIKDIKLSLHEGKKIVIGKVKSVIEYKCLERILKKKFKDFIIYEYDSGMEIFTLKENLLKSVEKLSYLYSDDIFIGWGCGDNISEARYYAELALKKQINFKGELLVYIEKSKEYILSKDINKDQIDLSIYSIFQKINIDKELGDKLIEFLKKNENLSAEKLAINLQMSKRNASRILLKLESNGLATSFFEKISRGRPVKMFKLNHKIVEKTR